jgi:hypothetical protein
MKVNPRMLRERFRFRLKRLIPVIPVVCLTFIVLAALLQEEVGVHPNLIIGGLVVITLLLVTAIIMEIQR